MRDSEPDALLVPERLKSGATSRDRLDSILSWAEPMLGLGRGRVWIRRQPGGTLFVSGDPADTLYHAARTPLQGRPRYTWVDGELGIQRGYLTEAARAASATASATATATATVPVPEAKP